MKRRRKGEEKREEITDRTEQVFKAISSNPNITLRDLCGLLNISKKQAENSINKLRDKNRIHREGSDRNGKWIIN